MTVTTREKRIGMGAGAMVLLLLAYQFVVSPYLDQRAQLLANIKVAQDKRTREMELLNNRGKVATAWKGLLAGTLRTTAAEAGSKTQDALYDWAGPAGFDLRGVNQPSAMQSGDFQRVNMTIQGVGSESNVARWVWAIENSKYPLEIDDILVTPRKEGTDDLMVKMDLTVLVFSPAPPKAGAAVVTGEDK